MLQVTQKDRDRAKDLSKKFSGAQRQAFLDKIKDPVKMLCRGIAMAEVDQWEGQRDVISIKSYNEFYRRAENLGASQDLLNEFIDRVIAHKKNHDAIQKEKERIEIEKLDATLKPGLTYDVMPNTWCNYFITLPGKKKSMLVDIYFSHSDNEYYFNYKKTSRSKNTYRYVLGGWSVYNGNVKNRKLKIEMINKYNIRCPYGGNRKIRMHKENWLYIFDKEKFMERYSHEVT